MSLKILIIKISSMGDVVQCLPAVTEALAQNPNLQFDWVVDNTFSDLRFYFNNPIYIDTKSLGISYYAGKPYFEKYKKRFDLAYAYEYCENQLVQKDKKRINYINKILKLLNLNKKEVCDISNNLDNEFKKNNIKYLIDIKRPKIDYSKKVCEGQYCLYKIK